MRNEKQNQMSYHQLSKLRGNHELDLKLSRELRERVIELADRYDKSISDMVRELIEIGIPIMEALDEVKQETIKQLVNLKEWR